VTNAQYARFVQAGGFKDQQWWDAAGWEYVWNGWVYEREYLPTGVSWAGPRYADDPRWNGAHQPVVGVNWYAADAFCRWLSQVTGETIVLPTATQWQYAAQGEDGRLYPWGNTWEDDRCNHAVGGLQHQGTTLVDYYGERGLSACGVADMAGNVREWCRSEEPDSPQQLLLGSAWNSNWMESFQCAYHFAVAPAHYDCAWGFRLVRLGSNPAAAG
jgi:formylglycine-generating enzyme required for sulfatase activity